MTHQQTRTHDDPHDERHRPDQPGSGRAVLIFVLVALLVAALVVGGFFLLGGDADVDVDEGDVDVTLPSADVDVNAPDIDVESPDISVDPGGVDVEEAPEAEADAGN